MTPLRFAITSRPSRCEEDLQPANTAAECPVGGDNGEQAEDEKPRWKGRRHPQATLPDWMHPFENEGFELGPEVTACLVDWEQRSARRRGITAFPFVDELLELEASTQGLSLDGKVLARFIRRLDAEAKSEVRKGIQRKRNQSPWKQALESAHSSWFRIYSELCRRQDPSAYLKDCRARISQDWTLALPVAKDLERKKNYAQASGLCAAALSSFLRLPQGEKWELRKNLLAGSYRMNGEGNTPLQNLLQIWGRSARALQEEEVAVAARLQADLLKDWRNWDKAIAAFRRIPQPGFSALGECLFARWRELVATRSVDSDADRPEKPHWVHALADAAREGEGTRHSISVWLRQWLQAIERDGATLRQSEAALVRLSLDLDRAQWLSRVSPTMVRLLAYNRSYDRTLDASRKKWLKRLGIFSLVPELLAFWRRNARHLVPDPAAARGADYRDCADWVQALRELNPASCEDLLRQWSVTQQRRRNLWRALQAKGLSMSSGNRRC